MAEILYAPVLDNTSVTDKRTTTVYSKGLDT